MLPLPGIDSLPIGSELEDSGSRNLESAAAGFLGSSARVGWHAEAGNNDVGNRDNMGVAKPEEESLRISSSERCNQTRPMGPGDDASVLYAEGLDHIDYRYVLSIFIFRLNQPFTYTPSTANHT